MAKKSKAQRDAEFKSTWGYAQDKETPEQRFKRLAMVRMNKVLKQIALLGNLSGSRYKSETAQISKMETAFKDTLTEAFGRLRGQKAAKNQFSL